MEKGSPEWIDTKLLTSMDRMWSRKGKYLSAYDFLNYFIQQGYCVPLDTINERLHALHTHGLIEAQYAHNGAGPNAPYLLRYSRVRGRIMTEMS